MLRQNYDSVLNIVSLQFSKISTLLFAHGISVFVGLRTDSFFFSFSLGAISFFALFCCVCSLKKSLCPPAALGHKIDSFSFQVIYQQLLSDLVTNVCFSWHARAATSGSLGIFKTGDLLIDSGIRTSETNGLLRPHCLFLEVDTQVRRKAKGLHSN